MRLLRDTSVVSLSLVLLAVVIVMRLDWSDFQNSPPRPANYLNRVVLTEPDGTEQQSRDVDGETVAVLTDVAIDFHIAIVTRALVGGHGTVLLAV